MNGMHGPQFPLSAILYYKYLLCSTLAHSNRIAIDVRYFFSLVRSQREKKNVVPDKNSCWKLVSIVVFRRNWGHSLPFSMQSSSLPILPTQLVQRVAKKCMIKKANNKHQSCSVHSRFNYTLCAQQIDRYSL